VSIGCVATAEHEHKEPCRAMKCAKDGIAESMFAWHYFPARLRIGKLCTLMV
jgi:hypothetical protein